MKILGNILWLLFGGLETALEYFVASIARFITIIGIPFGLQSIKLGVFCLWPFGSKVRAKEGQPGCLSTVMNVIWFFVVVYGYGSPISSSGYCFTSPS